MVEEHDTGISWQKSRESEIRMDGVLLINKLERLTSHDVVARVRRMFRTRKVGHAGTLDPFATGLLVLCLGKATRIVEYLVGWDKEYIATMRLGISTDTQDLTGQTIVTRPIPELSQVELHNVFADFVGTIQQVPPMFSAKKVDGKRLYALARQGKTVARAARQVTIHALEIMNVALPDVQFRVTCSSGTYVRTLAHDLGEALKCGAHLTTLMRTRVGAFSLEDAYAFKQLAHITDRVELTQILVPMDYALAFFPAVTLNNDLAEKILHGVRLEFTDNGGEMTGCDTTKMPQMDQMCRLYSEHGVFLGLGQWMQGNIDNRVQWILQPRKVLIDSK